MADFKSDMQAMAVNLIDNVFGATGQVSQKVIITHPIVSMYDEATDVTYTDSISQEMYGVVGPWTKNALAAQNGITVKTNDLSLKVAFLNLEFKPTADVDVVTLINNDQYLIMFTRTDAAEACMTMMLRRLKEANDD